MSRKLRYFVIYPEYFDKSLSRREGRKVPKHKAVEDCTLSKIAFACKHLNFEYIIEKEKKYPKNWWKSEGRILVNPEHVQSKTELIRRIANIARKLKKVEKKPAETKKKKKQTAKKRQH